MLTMIGVIEKSIYGLNSLSGDVKLRVPCHLHATSPLQHHPPAIKNNPWFLPHLASHNYNDLSKQSTKLMITTRRH